jgi:hypothetical protein
MSTINGDGHSKGAESTRADTGRPMLAFEIEENDDEIDSLINETSDATRNTDDINNNNNNTFIVRGLQSAHQRKLTNGNTNNGNGSDSSVTIIMNIRGLLRSSIGLASTYRNFVILACLAGVCILLVLIENTDVRADTMDGSQYRKPQYHPHEASFGGVQNSAHYDTSQYDWRYQNDDEIDLSYEEYLRTQNTDTLSNGQCNYFNNMDTNSTQQQTINNETDRDRIVSNIGQVVISTDSFNHNDDTGHYWHDPIRSPYSSKLYKSNSITKFSDSNDTLSQSQLLDNEYALKQELLRNEYGYWNQPIWPNSTIKKFTVPKDNIIYENRDVPIEKFSPLSWHLQSQYVASFLKEAKDLVHRIQEGIYTEYGMTSSNADDAQVLQRRQQSFNIQKMDYFDNHEVQVDTSITGQGRIVDIKSRQSVPCGSYLTNDAYNMLVRKLLHAIITEGTFLVVVVSSGDYTYQANNMFQTQIMQFQYLLQPVFDKLGIELVSRNMGMDTRTTSINSLGGADVYGESDILWYIPDHREHVNADAEQTVDHFDLLHIQSILSGERVPIILTPNPGSIPKELHDQNKEIWMGNIQPGYENICSHDPETTIDACKYIYCNEEQSDDPSCTSDEQYNSICWVDRSDYTPKSIIQNKTIGHTNEQYKNPNQHLLDSRKLSMLLLQALDEAINVWMSAQTVNTTVLIPNEMWHVSKAYNTMKESVRDIMTSGCDTLLKDISRKICHIQMHTFTEWTPRAKDFGLDFASRRIAADETMVFEELYNNIDLLPLQWRLPDNHVDVHMLGILTNTTKLQQHIEHYSIPTKNSDVRIPTDDDYYMFSNDDKSAGRYFDYEDDSYPSNLEDSPDDNIDKQGNSDQDPTRRKTRIRQQRRNLLDPNDVDESAQLSKSSSTIRLTQPKTKSNGVPAFGDDVHNYKTANVERRVESPLRLSKDRWTVYKKPIGYCDGSSESRCNRSFRNTCLLANYNQYKAGIMGHSNSGPIHFQIDGIHEGIVLARFDWDDDGVKPMSELPDDFIFQYTIYLLVRSIWGTKMDVLVQQNLTKTQFQSMGKKLASDFIVHPLWIEDQRQHETKCRHVSVEIEIKSPSSQDKATALLLTHLYYA